MNLASIDAAPVDLRRDGLADLIERTAAETDCDVGHWLPTPLQTQQEGQPAKGRAPRGNDRV
jgi:hypothetical protein